MKNEENEAKMIDTKKGYFEKLGEALGQSVDPKVVIFGEAPEPLPNHEETPVAFTGVLDSPARWLEKRLLEDKDLNQIDPLYTHVIIDDEAMQITMITEERNHFKNIIVGKLEVSAIFQIFGINNRSQQLEPAEMADLIKMNRAFFESTADAMVLVAELKNFRAKINKEVEKLDDNRASKTELTAQAVESNIPKSFKMVLPLFKGEPKETIECEVYINATNLKCSLVSPEAAEKMEKTKDNAIAAVKDRILKVDKSIVVFNK